MTDPVKIDVSSHEALLTSLAALPWPQRYHAARLLRTPQVARQLTEIRVGAVAEGLTRGTYVQTAGELGVTQSAVIKAAARYRELTARAEG